MILQVCFSSTLVWRFILFFCVQAVCFFFYSFLLFYLFLLYSKAQLSTVADLRFLFALLQLPSVYLNYSARQWRATYREYLVWCTCAVHRRGVWMQCSWARVCVFEFNGEYKSFNICFVFFYFKNCFASTSIFPINQNEYVNCRCARVWMCF